MMECSVSRFLQISSTEMQSRGSSGSVLVFTSTCHLNLFGKFENLTCCGMIYRCR